ncbi:hypothetical protein CMV_012765 [Castanea mollissima]|uniref:Uncharacterized protein n=1 Tax=Castanea mollissima TaxID=60419 RepID=A0A8J4R302_9ROSI|nr:hypothetical protein CMV_012765 [Castanea mollissima]
MATTLLLLLLSAILTAEAQQGESIVSLGSFLTPETNSSWLSSSGLYAFGFYQQTNGYAIGVFLAGIPEKTSQYISAETRLVSSVSESDQSTGIFQLVMQTDGNLVQYSLVLELKPEYAYRSSVTFGNNASLCLDDDGRLYLLTFTGTYLRNLT